MTGQTSTKDPRETVVLTIDATLELATGETLSSAGTPDITIAQGYEAAVSLTLIGVAVNNAPITVGGVTIATGCAVQAVMAAGSSGVLYLIAITCPTSNPDKILTLKALVPVSAQ